MRITRTNLFVLLAAFVVSGCGLFDEESSKSELTDTNIFVLCEGTFGASDASLWQINWEEETVNGPVYQNLTGTPLGDVGQSLTLNGDKLYVINNNSHTIEVLALDQDIRYETTINLPKASPREMAILNNRGYVTCWGLSAILVIDLNNNQVTDTVFVTGMPEDIVVAGGDLYTSIILNTDWSNGNQVLKISPASLAIVDTFTVVPGPGQMLVSGNDLYVASTYYNSAWEAGAGTSRIDLTTGTVQTNDYGITPGYSGDLVEFNGRVYRALTDGAAPLLPDLSTDNKKKIGSLTGVYSLAVFDDYLLFGLTDYASPDEVKILDEDGELIVEFEVGVYPGSFAVYTK
ncbi:MAG: hypothetical protein GXO92_04900 [FCB group bacterium]|nr:hypothetical protein [FCB group bacterium]